MTGFGSNLQTLQVQVVYIIDSNFKTQWLALGSIYETFLIVAYIFDRNTNNLLGFEIKSSTSAHGYFGQVSAAPKKKAKDKKEESSKLEPKTLKECAENQMSEMLKSAGAARKQSIQLSDLSVELLEFAKTMEGHFIKIQSALDSSDEKQLQSLVLTAVQREKEGEKAKAWLSFFNFRFKKTFDFYPHIISW